MATSERDYLAELADETEPVHGWFELSYASYFTVPRSVLEAMPISWQRQFIALVNEMNDTLDWERFLPDRSKDDYHFEVRLRAGNGRFIPDVLRDYRHPVRIPLKRTESTNALTGKEGTE